MNWNILSITSGQELVCHEMLVNLGFTVFTPFEKKRQLKTVNKKEVHVHYAQPVLPGWLLIQFDGSDAMKTKLFNLMERRPMFYGALTHGGELYEWPNKLIDKYREVLTELSMGSHKRIVPRGYDPSLDSRKNLQRGHSDAVDAPVFDKGETVEFSNGAWGGLKLEVTRYGKTVVQLEANMMGRRTKLEASPHDLQKIA